MVVVVSLSTLDILFIIFFFDDMLDKLLLYPHHNIRDWLRSDSTATTTTSSAARLLEHDRTWAIINSFNDPCVLLAILCLCPLSSTQYTCVCCIYINKHLSICINIHTHTHMVNGNLCFLYNILFINNFFYVYTHTHVLDVSSLLVFKI